MSIRRTSPASSSEPHDRGIFFEAKQLKRGTIEATIINRQTGEVQTITDTAQNILKTAEHLDPFQKRVLKIHLDNP